MPTKEMGRGRTNSLGQTSSKLSYSAKQSAFKEVLREKGQNFSNMQGSEEKDARVKSSWQGLNIYKNSSSHT